MNRSKEVLVVSDEIEEGFTRMFESKQERAQTRQTLSESRPRESWTDMVNWTRHAAKARRKELKITESTSEEDEIEAEDKETQG